MKKILLYAGLFLGSFAVINTGVYFFLKATQPKTVVAATGEHEGADSSLASSEAPHGNEKESAPAKSVDAQESAAPGEEPVVNAVEPSGPKERSNEHPAEAKRTLNKKAAVKHSPPPEEEPLVEQQDESDYVPEQEPEIAGTGRGAPAPEETAVDTSTTRIAKLAKLLESMKPSDAASIASELDTDVIVSIVLRMKDRNAAKIMAALPVELAQEVAQQMSQVSSR